MTGDATMRQLGVMLYGYGERDAMRIKAALDQALATDVELMSASGREGSRVMDVIEVAPLDRFDDREPKVLMVLGMDDPEVDAALKGFPSGEGVPRPIFCSLTRHNASWTVQQLIGDLLKERAYFEGRRRGPAPHGRP